jgi:hypothetical protein
MSDAAASEPLWCTVASGVLIEYLTGGGVGTRLPHS